MLEDKLCSSNSYTDYDVTEGIHEVACSISPAELQCAMHDIFVRYKGWNFNFGNNPLDWIQELLE